MVVRLSADGAGPLTASRDGPVIAADSDRTGALTDITGAVFYEKVLDPL